MSDLLLHEETGGVSDIRLVRKNLWSLSGDNVKSEWFSSLQIDYTSKKLTLGLFQFITPDLDDPHLSFVESAEWAEQYAKEFRQQDLTLTTTDAEEEPVYQVRFEGCKIVKRTDSFDYNSTDPAIHKIEMTFEAAKKRFV